MFEKFGKITAIFKTDWVGDIFDGEFGTSEEFFGFTKANIGEKGFGSLPDFLYKEAMEIGAVDSKVIGDVSYTDIGFVVIGHKANSFGNDEVMGRLGHLFVLGRKVWIELVEDFQKTSIEHDVITFRN